MKRFFYFMFWSLWLFVFLSPIIFKQKTPSDMTTDTKNLQHIISLNGDNLEEKSKFNLESKNIKINEFLYAPKNVEILNVGTSQKKLTLTWEKIVQEGLSNSAIEYKIYRKTGKYGTYIPLDIEKNLSYNALDNKYTYADHIVIHADQVSEWVPLRYYSYVISSVLTSDGSQSEPSKPVSGYLLPDRALYALSDIWKTLEISNSNTNGFSSLGGSSEYKVGNIFGYFKRTRRPIRNSTDDLVYYTYEYNQFAAYNTITIDGILNGTMMSDDSSTIILNGELVITGIYSANLKIIDLIVSSETGIAQGGSFIVEYNNNKQELSYNNSLLDTLIRNKTI